MSTHPNVILMAVFTPDDLPMKTHRAIMADVPNPYEYDLEGLQVEVGSEKYYVKCCEGYDEDNQISARPGEIIAHSLITYGYGEFVTWDKLAGLKNDLEAWAKGICEKHKCSFEIRVLANYW
jgi:hypothetical protein